ncbi:ORF6N domain-containing protein [Bacillus badius]|uniref:Phage antirepressor protein n=1 Tax=Bacillus badius TaxID=1455 RepID=A0ABR5AY45_BACBA|nr:ORF6N domain-containing protein [Bacillus badius]KIL79545.1 Phage antirepressor protein [Bacillus badius]MED4718630.1 ORF6N domain-containing protein [Bacillus badius]
MNQLQVIEQNGMRVLTTAQLAEAYGTDIKRISENFSRNKDRYKIGKHYIELAGGELKSFKQANPQIAESLKFASLIYLWTEKGAWLHAKSLNTDAAWTAYEMLVDEYYAVKEQSQLSTEQLTSMLAARLGSDVVELKQDVAEIKQQVSEVREEITLNHGQQTVLHHEIKKRVEFIKDNYELTSKQIYSQIHSQLRRAFAAPKYFLVRRKDYEEAISWVRSWRPLI